MLYEAGSHKFFPSLWLGPYLNFKPFILIRRPVPSIRRFLCSMFTIEDREVEDGIWKIKLMATLYKHSSVIRREIPKYHYYRCLATPLLWRQSLTFVRVLVYFLICLFQYKYDYEVNVSHPIPAMYDLCVWAATAPFYGSFWSYNKVIICPRAASGW